MRPKNKPRKERRTTAPSDRRDKANEQGEAEKAVERLLATLYRKEAGCMTVKLSELTLYRLAEGVHIPLGERNNELRSSVLAHLDRHGVVNHRVIRRQVDRLRIIEQVLTECVDMDDVETLTSIRQVAYRLSDSQMKKQAKASKEHDRRVNIQREERVRTKKPKKQPPIARAV